jgi:hypothetical protein
MDLELCFDNGQKIQYGVVEFEIVICKILSYLDPVYGLNRDLN